MIRHPSGTKRTVHPIRTKELTQIPSFQNRVSKHTPVGLGYLLLTGFGILVAAVTTLKIGDLWPAYLLLWISFLTYALGRRFCRSDPKPIRRADPKYWLARITGPKLGLLAGLSLVCSVTAANYFTGATPASVLSNLVRGSSVYENYQDHNDALVRSMTTFQAIPYILMNLYAQGIFLYGMITLFVLQKRVSRNQTLFLTISAAAATYGAFARGTTFEAFKLAVLLLFSLLVRPRKIKSLKIITMITVVCAAAIALFVFNVLSRGAALDTMTANEASLDTTSSIYQYVPALGGVIGLMYGYFGFGFYFLSTYVRRFWLDNPSAFFAGLFPQSLGMDYRDAGSVMFSKVDVGPRWTPDTFLVLVSLGAFGFFLVCFIFGVCEARLANSFTPTALIARYLIFVQMLSFPIGNFISVSTEYRAFAVLLVSYFVLKTIRSLTSSSQSRRSLSSKIDCGTSSSLRSGRKQSVTTTRRGAIRD